MEELTKEIDKHIEARKRVLEEYSIMFDKIEEYFKYHPDVEIFHGDYVFKLIDKRLCKVSLNNVEKQYYYETPIDKRIEIIETLINKLSLQLLGE